MARSPLIAKVGALLLTGVALIFWVISSGSAVHASVPAGSTIVLRVPTNGECTPGDVTQHTEATDEVTMDGTDFIFTRHVDIEIADDDNIQFAAQVDTTTSGCRMEEPVVMTINGDPSSPTRTTFPMAVPR